MQAENIKKRWAKVEDQLETADILLFHKRQGPLTKRIQEATQSYWNHVGLVFVPKKDLPIGGPLIVEATYGGIEIHQLRKYTGKPEMYDLGVKRFPGLTEKEREKIVTDFILKHIDVPYDYTRLLGFYLAPLIIKFSPKLFLKAANYFIHENSFICSTFAYTAFSKLYKKRGGEVKQTVEATANQLRGKKKEAMYAPADIARSDIFEWMFNPKK